MPFRFDMDGNCIDHPAICPTNMTVEEYTHAVSISTPNLVMKMASTAWSGGRPFNGTQLVGGGGPCVCCLTDLLEFFFPLLETCSVSHSRHRYVCLLLEWTGKTELHRTHSAELVGKTVLYFTTKVIYNLRMG